MEMELFMISVMFLYQLVLFRNRMIMLLSQQHYSQVRRRRMLYEQARRRRYRRHRLVMLQLALHYYVHMCECNANYTTNTAGESLLLFAST